MVTAPHDIFLLLTACRRTTISTLLTTSQIARVHGALRRGGRTQFETERPLDHALGLKPAAVSDDLLVKAQFLRRIGAIRGEGAIVRRRGLDRPDRFGERPRIHARGLVARIRE